MFPKVVPHLSALLLVVFLSDGLQAQVDTSSIGGPIDNSSYEETGEGLRLDAEALVEEWTAADSAILIPAYSIYGDWNTDQIFQQMEVTEDSTVIRLAYADCDHYMPVCGRITSPFGWRNGRNHYGIDLKLYTGDPVMSAFSGRVRISRYHRDFGHVVVIRHPNGLETLYAHMSKRLVNVDDEVEAGDVIGLGGSTGRSTGSHLHFEIRYLGHPIDPSAIFDMELGLLHDSRFVVRRDLFGVPQGQREAPSHYRVRKGDTLYAISRRTGIPVARLCRMNGIRASNTLRVGQQLRVN